jgi:hypothetical protein
MELNLSYKGTVSWLGDPGLPIKGLLPFRQKTRDPDPIQHVNHSSTLLIMSVFTQYQPARRRAITSTEGIELA